MIKSSRWLGAFLALLLISPVSALATVKLTIDHPDSYQVKAGDTLWDIAAKFLQQPWQWPEIWQKNQQIENPHLIYPGDLLQLVYVDGKPQIVMQQPSNGYATVKLSPTIKQLPLDEAIPSVSYRAIHAFLKDGKVITDKQLKKSPYVLADKDDRPFYGAGDTIYARDSLNSWQDAGSRFGVYRVGERYIDPDSNEVLGYEALLVGELEKKAVTDELATMHIVSSTQEIGASDLVLQRDKQHRPASFFPKAPEAPVEGKIIHLFDALTGVGRNDVVVVNVGARDALVNGDVLAIEQAGRVVTDEKLNQLVTLPAEKIGVLLLFKVFDKVSYGLVMESNHPISLGDGVINPD